MAFGASSEFGAPTLTRTTTEQGTPVSRPDNANHVFVEVVMRGIADSDRDKP